MTVQKPESLPPPPGVMGSLRAGFDIVSNRIALILAPLALDVFLWLGPRLSVYELLKPFFQFVFIQARQGVSDSQLEQFSEMQDLFMNWLRDFNLFSLLTKLTIFPIGISSLSAQILPVETPLGTRTVIEVTSAIGFIGLSFAFVLIGWIVGGLYFRGVAVSIFGGSEAPIGSGRAIAQTLFLCMLWSVGLLMIFFPAMFVLGILALISPILANSAILVFLFFSFWLIVPLYFAPHGIFIRKQNAFSSLFASLRMARFTLPTSGLFVLSVFLLSRGLDYLWGAPQSDSWLALVGFAGHAFITTALLAASFVYYRDMNDWLQNTYEKWLHANQPSSAKQV
ncbi:MAG TPA: hypothetical protein VNK49_04935 [Anaerolineales bacterium]|nr:hypothetical protein [Anaerolineales bacterium]